MTTALVLAGHGSHISPNTAGIVWALVDELRALGIADEITAAFWKEAPSFHQVLDTVTADDVTIVPLFTARGYFTHTVIPAEMALEGDVTVRDGRTIRYTHPLGDHPYLSQIVRNRVEQALEQYSISYSETAVALIGHGTRRNPESRGATEAQAANIRNSNLVAEAVAVYLDDVPDILQLYSLTTAPHVVAVPYFLASGSHTTLDVPAELGLQPGQAVGQVQGRSIYYTLPVGDRDTLRDLVLDLARDAGMPLYDPQTCAQWNCYPRAGREELIDAVQAEGVIQFGQLLLSLSEVRVIGDVGPTTALADTTSLRARVREQSFRPLPTSYDLPGGWHVEIHSPDMLYAVVETVYPGAVADWAAHGRGDFHTTRLVEVAARQTGMFREMASLNRLHQSTLVDRVCGNCVRHPTWFRGSSPAEAIPCAEPCNFWMSKARNER